MQHSINIIDSSFHVLTNSKSDDFGGMTVEILSVLDIVTSTVLLPVGIIKDVVNIFRRNSSSNIKSEKKRIQSHIEALENKLMNSYSAREEEIKESLKKFL